MNITLGPPDIFLSVSFLPFVRKCTDISSPKRKGESRMNLVSPHPAFLRLFSYLSPQPESYLVNGQSYLVNGQSWLFLSVGVKNKHIFRRLENSTFFQHRDGSKTTPFFSCCSILSSESNVHKILLFINPLLTLFPNLLLFHVSV